MFAHNNCHGLDDFELKLVVYHNFGGDLATGGHY